MYFCFTRKTSGFTRKTLDFTRKTSDFTRKTVIYDTDGLPYTWDERELVTVLGSHVPGVLHFICLPSWSRGSRHQCRSININGLVYNAVKEPKSCFGTSLFQQWPAQLTQHGAHTCSLPVAVADKSSCPPLYSFQFADVILSEWVPDRRSIFQFRPQDGFVGHVLD